MPAPTGCAKIVQVHPTRRCNLRCLHCYSSSGPEERGALAPALLASALTDAAAAGYDVASFSGGEPLLYAPLRALLTHAHALGMRTTVTTNGMLIDGARLETLRGAADLVAVSLDGTPESHNRVRGSERAFAGAAAGIARLRDAGIPFGLIFTLTQYNLDELDWAASFALEQGARLLQIHPLEEVGHAAAGMQGERPDAFEAAYAYVETMRIAEAAGERLAVQFDLAHRDHFKAEPARFFAAELPAEADALPFAELVSPLVIEPDGMVAPVHYGLARAYALGNLHDAGLAELMSRWRATRLRPFRALCREVFDQFSRQEGLPFFNWYEALGAAARRVEVAHAAAL